MDRLVQVDLQGIDKTDAKDKGSYPRLVADMGHSDILSSCSQEVSVLPGRVCAVHLGLPLMEATLLYSSDQLPEVPFLETCSERENFCSCLREFRHSKFSPILWVMGAIMVEVCEISSLVCSCNVSTENTEGWYRFLPYVHSPDTQTNY